MKSQHPNESTLEADRPDPGAVAMALAELEEGRRRLATARSKMDDPRIAMELQRLVAARQAALDDVVHSIRHSEALRLSDIALVDVTPDRSAIGLGAAVGGDGAVMTSLIRGETGTIDVLQTALDRPLPEPVEGAVRGAITQVGRSRDQLELVNR